MRRILALVAVASAIATSGSFASASGSFETLRYADNTQFTIACPANYECQVELERGERAGDGFSAAASDWDPHVGYSGTGQLTPSLMLRPDRPGLRTNVVLTTSRRTYRLLLVSTSSQNPKYYSFSYNGSERDTYRRLAKLSVATQTALRAQAAAAKASPPPIAADAVSLKSTCIDYNYAYYHDLTLPPDHKPKARANADPIPPEWIPETVCTDGEHTYIDFPIVREQPYDTPTYFKSSPGEPDEIINAIYNSTRRRYVIDNVYPNIVLVLGSQERPLRIRLLHNPDAHVGRGAPVPIPIETHAPIVLGHLPPPVEPATPTPSPRASARP